MDRDREAFEANLAEYEALMKAVILPADPATFRAGWQRALAYVRQNGEVCLACGTHSNDGRCDCTRLGSSDLRRPAVCAAPTDAGRRALAENAEER